ncbi:MAG: transposase [Vicinamibacterales bacterium]
MARQRRILPPASVVHVINRGNERRRLFERPSDYDDFLDLMTRVLARRPVRTLAYALMPNHWHLVLWPPTAADMSRFLHHLTTAHAARFRYMSGTAGLGHVYQGRYYSSIVKDDEEYLRTLLYVEANPVRARLVREADQWPWTSLTERLGSRRLIVDGPLALPPPPVWAALINHSAARSR